MRVVPPLTMTEARLTSSTATEPGVGETTWTSGATFALAGRAILGAPSSTVTISVASPGVVTWASNGLPDGTPVVLTTTGALPTGLAASTVYYVVNRASGTFQLSAQVDGSPIVTTGSQSGTHTATAWIHRNYESVVAGNTGNPPAIDDGTHWVDVGPTNRWACLDLLRNTATTFPASPGVVVITPGQRIDTLGLVDLIADEVTLTVDTAAGEVYAETFSLSTRTTLGWRDYFLGTFSFRAALAVFDLPAFVDAVITVEIVRASGLPSVGGLIVGTAVNLGNTQYASRNEALNFSKVDRDEFGNSILVPRRTVPKTSQQIWCEKARVNKVIAARDLLNAVPALWSGLDDDEDDYFEALLILGYYRSFSISLDHPDMAQIALELEEV